MNKFTVLLLSSLSYIYANPFQSTLENEISWLKEETFVISASKVKENIDKTPASIYVVTDKMIEEIGANDIFDALKIVPGIRIKQSYIYNNKISVRGVQTRSSEKVLVLLDGHSLNINLLNGGATDASKSLPIEFIKKIEVIKGPASALYGENAFTALINIITKKSEDIDGSVIKTKFGSNNTKSVNLLHGKKYDSNSIVININNQSTDGKSVFVKKDSINKSGYTNPTLSSTNMFLSVVNDNGFYFKGNYNEIKDGSNYGATHMINDTDLSKRRSYLLELGYKKGITNKTDIHLRTYYDNYKLDNKWEVNTNRIAYTGNEDEKIGLESILKTKKDNYVLLTGLSFEQQNLKNPTQKMNWNPKTENPFNTTASYNIIDYSNSDTNYIDEVDRNFWAFYSEILYDINSDLRINAGARYDYYNDFGKTINPRLGATWRINNNNNLKFLYAHAFRAPTFAELYNKNNPAVQGNPNLKPETVKTYEVTFENESIKNLKSTVTLFNTEIKDIILLENTIQTNKNKLITNGIEIEAKYNLSRGSYIIANFTKKYVENKTTKNKIANISQNNAFIAINKRINKFLNLYTEMEYVGSQTRLETDTRDDVPSSITNNMTLLIKNFKSKNLSIKLSAYNIFNTTTYDSAEPYDYPISGRSYMSELTYKF